MTHSRRKHHPSVDRRSKHRRKDASFNSAKEKRETPERREGNHRRLTRDRRRHMRFPVVTECVKPVEFKIFPSETKESLPGIITQLSPGGMTMVAFSPIKVGTSLFLTINLPHLKINLLEGKVVRVEQKGESYCAGIHFLHIKPDNRARLNQMALDYADCELKLSFGVTDVCFKDCGFYPLCEKLQKI